MEVHMSKLAYCKMFLHLAKYPHLACNGVLLGHKQLVDEEPRERIAVVDCVPLFHMSLSLAPGIEIALEQIDSYCEKSKTKLDIVGYYQANENALNNEPNAIALKYAEKLKENCAYSLVFMVDNNLISPNRALGAQPFYTIYNFNNQTLSKLNCKHKLEDKAVELCSHALVKKLFQQVYDFDNHLDDIRSDWLNLELNKQLQALSQRGGGSGDSGDDFVQTLSAKKSK